MVNLPDESKLSFKPSKNLYIFSGALIVVGLLLIVLQAVTFHASEAHPHNNRLWVSLHLALLVALPLGLGGIYFTAFNHVGGSAWSTILRRIAENYVWYLVFVLGLLAVILIFGYQEVFSHWAADNPKVTGDHLIQHKSAYLDGSKDGKSTFPTFFTVRNLLAVLVWIGLGFYLLKQSRAQDVDGKISRTRTMVKASSVFLVFFALSISFVSWDLSMSLEPHWFSTIWAVYIFGGMALITFASLILWMWYLKSSGYYGEALNENHLHDLSKYMWGHTVFWAYIGFSQYMLIWYAHLPEETTFYFTRYYGDNGHWSWVTLLLIFVRFVLPFFLIIRRGPKRNLNYMAAVSVLIILGQILDMYWIAYPTLEHGHFVMFSWQELGPLMLVFGAFILIVGRALSRSSLIPKKDPRLEECLHWHQ